MTSTYKIISALAITGIILVGYVMTRPETSDIVVSTPPPAQTSGTTSATVPNATKEVVLLSGTYVCLPLLDANGPKNDCAFGIKTDDGVYYAVNLGASAGSMADFKDGAYITAKGFIILSKDLRPNSWAKFSSNGLFTVIEKIQ